MIQLVYSPEWFFGHDVAIDIFSLGVLLLIGIFSIKCYRINKKKNYFWLAISFMLLALSFLFKIGTNFSLYYTVLTTRQIGELSLTFRSMAYSDIIFDVTFLLYRIFTLLGLYILYELYQKHTQKTKIILIVFLLLITAYFSSSAYYIFHLLSLILLVFITIGYYENYLKVKQNLAKVLTYGFATITLSQFFFIFTNAYSISYVIAEVIQLLGYMIVFFTFMMVLKYAKKKKQD